jgi:hypothetical protein
MTFIVTAYGLIMVGSAVLFYLVLRARVWREYYRFNDRSPDPSTIDRGDKILALLFATALAVGWIASLPTYLLWRHHVARQRRIIAGRYADMMMRRFDESYVEELDEH